MVNIVQYFAACLVSLCLCTAISVDAKQAGSNESQQQPQHLYAITSPEYKALKESSVAGHEGTTLAHLACLAVSVPLIFQLRILAQRFVNLIRIRKQQQQSRLMQNSVFNQWFITLVLDQTLLFQPILLSMTLLSHHTLSLCIVVAIMILALSFACHRLNGDWPLRWPFSQALDDQRSNDTMIDSQGRLIALTLYRTSMYITTFIAILAVDFPAVFPLSQFAKTERFGISLMDCGVGSFIISMALTSRHAQDKHCITLRQLIVQVVPLVVFACARLFTLAQVNYQLHASEYGVHWNFFATLVCMTLLSAGVHRMLSARHCALVALLVMTLYQLVLSQFGLSSFVLSDSIDRRESIWIANKEGIASSVGYAALYLISVSGAHALLRFTHSNANAISAPTCKQSGLSLWPLRGIQLLLLSLCAGAIHLLLAHYVEPASRRSVNAAYCAFVIAFNALVLGAMILLQACIAAPRPIDSVKSSSAVASTNRTSAGANSSSRQEPLDLVQLISLYPLCSFMLANALTGIVNLSVRTIYADKILSLALLSAYGLMLQVLLQLGARAAKRLASNRLLKQPVKLQHSTAADKLS